MTSFALFGGKIDKAFASIWWCLQVLYLVKIMFYQTHANGEVYKLITKPESLTPQFVEGKTANF